MLASPSTRREWIEILGDRISGFFDSLVSLHTEGVD